MATILIVIYIISVLINLTNTFAEALVMGIDWEDFFLSFVPCLNSIYAFFIIWYWIVN